MRRSSSAAPPYPGESCWIEYEYAVSNVHWGNWFQRVVRLRTNRLSVRLDFPADLRPAVLGLQTSMTAEAMPFRTQIQCQISEGRQVHSWSTDHPPLDARYRLEWDFRGRTGTDIDHIAPSEIMRSLGIVQDGDPALRQVARPLELPAEADDARRVVAELHAAAERVAQVHVFGKGMGIAAPQIGINRAAAIPTSTSSPSSNTAAPVPIGRTETCRVVITRPAHLTVGRIADGRLSYSAPVGLLIWPQGREYGARNHVW